MREFCGSRSVLVVDDNDEFRSLLCAVLDGAGYTVREVSSGEDALLAAEVQPPDVVLTDVNLPGISGYEVCRRLRERFGPALPIVFLSGDRVEPLDRAAGLLIGADDYVVKPFQPDELLARIRRLLPAAAGAGEQNGHGHAPVGLTAREQEILELLADGWTQSQIAGELVISSKTVGTHIQRILGKLGVHSRAQAVAVAHRHGFVAEDVIPSTLTSAAT